MAATSTLAAGATLAATGAAGAVLLAATSTLAAAGAAGAVLLAATSTLAAAGAAGAVLLAATLTLAAAGAGFYFLGGEEVKKDAKKSKIDSKNPPIALKIELKKPSAFFSSFLASAYPSSLLMALASIADSDWASTVALPGDEIALWSIADSSLT